MLDKKKFVVDLNEEQVKTTGRKIKTSMMSLVGGKEAIQGNTKAGPMIFGLKKPTVSHLARWKK